MEAPWRMKHDSDALTSKEKGALVVEEKGPEPTLMTRNLKFTGNDGSC
jgi:hypothetical protein